MERKSRHPKEDLQTAFDRGEESVSSDPGTSDPDSDESEEDCQGTEEQNRMNCDCKKKRKPQIKIEETSAEQNISAHDEHRTRYANPDSYMEFERSAESTSSSISFSSNDCPVEDRMNCNCKKHHRLKIQASLAEDTILIEQSKSKSLDDMILIAQSASESLDDATLGTDAKTKSKCKKQTQANTVEDLILIAQSASESSDDATLGTDANTEFKCKKQTQAIIAEDMILIAQSASESLDDATLGTDAKTKSKCKKQTQANTVEGMILIAQSASESSDDATLGTDAKTKSKCKKKRLKSLKTCAAARCCRSKSPDSLKNMDCLGLQSRSSGRFTKEVDKCSGLSSEQKTKNRKKKPCSFSENESVPTERAKPCALPTESVYVSYEQFMKFMWHQNLKQSSANKRKAIECRTSSSSVPCSAVENQTIDSLLALLRESDLGSASNMKIPTSFSSAMSSDPCSAIKETTRRSSTSKSYDLCLEILEEINRRHDSTSEASYSCSKIKKNTIRSSSESESSEPCLAINMEAICCSSALESSDSCSTTEKEATSGSCTSESSDPCSATNVEATRHSSTSESSEPCSAINKEETWYRSTSELSDQRSTIKMAETWHSSTSEISKSYSAIKKEAARDGSTPESSDSYSAIQKEASRRSSGSSGLGSKSYSAIQREATKHSSGSLVPESGLASHKEATKRSSFSSVPESGSAIQKETTRHSSPSFRRSESSSAIVDLGKGGSSVNRMSGLAPITEEKDEKWKEQKGDDRKGNAQEGDDQEKNAQEGGDQQGGNLEGVDQEGSDRELGDPKGSDWGVGHREGDDMDNDDEEEEEDVSSSPDASGLPGNKSHDLVKKLQHELDVCRQALLRTSLIHRLELTCLKCKNESLLRAQRSVNSPREENQTDDFERNQLKEKMSDLMSEQNDLRHTLNKTTHALNERTCQLECVQKELAEQRTSLECMTAMKDCLKAENEKLSRNLESTNDKLLLVQRELLEAQCGGGSDQPGGDAAMQSLMNALKEDKERTKSHLECQITSLTWRNAELKCSLKQAECSSSELKNELSRLEESVKCLQRKLKSSFDRNQAADMEVESHKCELKLLCTKLDDKCARLAEIEKCLTSAGAKTCELSKRVKELECETAELKTSADVHINKIDQLLIHEYSLTSQLLMMESQARESDERCTCAVKQRVAPARFSSAHIASGSAPLKSSFTPTVPGSGMVTSGSMPITSSFAPNTSSHEPITPGYVAITSGFTPMTSGFTPIASGCTPITSDFPPMTSDSNPIKPNSTDKLSSKSRESSKWSEEKCKSRKSSNFCDKNTSYQNIFKRKHCERKSCERKAPDTDICDRNISDKKFSDRNNPEGNTSNRNIPNTKISNMINQENQADGISNNTDCSARLEELMAQLCQLQEQLNIAESRAQIAEQEVAINKCLWEEEVASRCKLAKLLACLRQTGIETSKHNDELKRKICKMSASKRCSDRKMNQLSLKVLELRRRLNKMVAAAIRSGNDCSKEQQQELMSLSEDSCSGGTSQPPLPKTFNNKKDKKKCTKKECKSSNERKARKAGRCGKKDAAVQCSPPVTCNTSSNERKVRKGGGCGKKDATVQCCLPVTCNKLVKRDNNNHFCSHSQPKPRASKQTTAACNGNNSSDCTRASHDNDSMDCNDEHNVLEKPFPDFTSEPVPDRATIKERLRKSIVDALCSEPRVELISALKYLSLTH